MATAIDFKAMMIEERRKMKLEALAKVNAAKQHQEGGKDSSTTPRVLDSTTSTELCMGWLEYPDREVNISPKPKIDLGSSAVGTEIVSGIHYIPNFITDEEAADIVNRVEEMPESSWATLKRRRLQNHGGTPHPSGMVPKPVPHFISSVMQSTVQAGIFDSKHAPNHVLLNEYKRGQGIAPHQDGPLYEPMVAILSLSGPAMLQFWSSLDSTRAGEAVASVMCLPKSLLVFRQDAYLTHWHGIDASTSDTIKPHTGNLKFLKGSDLSCGSDVQRGSKRISLTIRRVLKLNDPERELLNAEGIAENKRKQHWWINSRSE
eukprot:m.169216 g.169216  ORF g.169216 m.169216 type:complete len:318 (-) comp31557_c0_seq1:186-1139(-)